MARKRKPGFRTGGVLCPICDSMTTSVDVPKDIATAFNINPGKKYICTGKFIWRSATNDIQFSKCYGIPVEGAVKMLQLADVTKADVINVMQNWAKSSYIKSVIAADQFFKNMTQYIPKEQKKDTVPTTDEFDPKAGWDE
jgi:hypothetical protein